MTTSLWTAQDALRSQMLAQAAFAAVGVDLGTPSTRDSDTVYISGSVTSWAQEYGVSSLAFKDETFTLQVVMQFARLGATYVEMRDLIAPYLEALNQAVRGTDGRSDLGNAVMLAQIADLELMEDVLDERTRQLTAVARIDCRAWNN
jgi:hypothetical protein